MTRVKEYFFNFASKRLTLDSNIPIAICLDTDETHQEALSLIEKAERNDVKIFVPTVVISESKRAIDRKLRLLAPVLKTLSEKPQSDLSSLLDSANNEKIDDCLVKIHRSLMNYALIYHDEELRYQIELFKEDLRKHRKGKKKRSKFWHLNNVFQKFKKEYNKQPRRIDAKSIDDILNEISYEFNEKLRGFSQNRELPLPSPSLVNEHIAEIRKHSERLSKAAKSDIRLVSALIEYLKKVEDNDRYIFVSKDTRHLIPIFSFLKGYIPKNLKYSNISDACKHIRTSDERIQKVASFVCQKVGIPMPSTKTNTLNIGASTLKISINSRNQGKVEHYFEPESLLSARIDELLEFHIKNKKFEW